MTKLLHLIGSPRAGTSKSTALGLAYVEAAQRKNPTLQIDTLDPWAEDLPAFDGDFAAAKMTFFGDGQMDAAKQRAWDQVTALTARFIAADHYVISAPMWNGGIPYRLKHYIDIITQPGLLFGFEPERGYFGLLEGKKATLAVSSGVWHPGADPKYGLDFHTAYLEWWLRTVGVSDIEVLRFQPSLMNADPEGSFHAAQTQARTIA